MSNPDSFIAEVAEEVRRDRLFALFRRYGWIAGLVVLVVVGGTAWHEWRKARDRAAAEAFGDAVLAAANLPDRNERLAAFAAIRATGAQAALLRLLEAGEAAAAGDRDAALDRLRAVTTDAAAPEAWRHLAALKRVALGGGAVPLAERERTLEPLLAPGNAFRPLALEQLALLRVEAGDPAAALALVAELLEQPEVTPALRRRAMQLRVALGAAPPAG